MIDIENQLITDLRELTGLPVEDPGRFPEKMPCVTLEWIGSETYRNSLDSGTGEHHARQTFEINIYSASIESRKTECKHYFDMIDDFMLRRGFTRLTRIPYSKDSETLDHRNGWSSYTQDNRMYYRILCRYTGTVDANATVYQ